MAALISSVRRIKIVLLDLLEKFFLESHLTKKEWRGSGKKKTTKISVKQYNVGIHQVWDARSIIQVEGEDSKNNCRNYF